MATIDERMNAVLATRAAHIAACRRYADATREASDARIALAHATNELQSAESALQREMIAVMGAPVHKAPRRICLDNATYSKTGVGSRG
jgi:hypothetical protein